MNQKDKAVKDCPYVSKSKDGAHPEINAETKNCPYLKTNGGKPAECPLLKDKKGVDVGCPHLNAGKEGKKKPP
jgi:hypothetical protein